MKSFLIVFMPLLIVATLSSCIHFINVHFQVMTVVLYFACWVSASLWIAALTTKKWAE